jgi:NAD(P)-dependent dehydrogenase (short-subunit alcohol dehydrogenase family)
MGGAHVFVTARRPAELDNAASVIGKNVTAIAGDLSRLKDIDRIAAEVKAGKGGFSPCRPGSELLFINGRRNRDFGSY